MIKAIFFDAGGVLVRDRSEIVFRKFVKLVKVPLKTARKAYFNSPDRKRVIEGKITRHEFYSRVCKKLRRQPLSRQIIASLSPAGKPPIIPQTLRIAKRLKDSGYIVGVISNTMASRRSSRFWFSYGHIFRPLVLSYEVGVKKPNRQIFGIAHRRAGVKLSEMVFLDDKKNNADAAKKLGINAFVYKNPAQLIRALRRFGIRV